MDARWRTAGRHGAHLAHARAARRYIDRTHYIKTQPPADRKNEVLARVRKLQDAIKLAKEQANLLDVERQTAAEQVFGFVFGS